MQLEGVRDADDSSHRLPSLPVASLALAVSRWSRRPFFPSVMTLAGFPHQFSLLSNVAMLILPRHVILRSSIGTFHFRVPMVLSSAFAASPELGAGRVQFEDWRQHGDRIRQSMGNAEMTPHFQVKKGCGFHLKMVRLFSSLP